jgi:hypothetical protein
MISSPEVSSSVARNALLRSLRLKGFLSDIPQIAELYTAVFDSITVRVQRFHTFARRQRRSEVAPEAAVQAAKLDTRSQTSHACS